MSIFYYYSIRVIRKYSFEIFYALYTDIFVTD